MKRKPFVSRCKRCRTWDVAWPTDDPDDDFGGWITAEGFRSWGDGLADVRNVLTTRETSREPLTCGYYQRHPRSALPVSGRHGRRIRNAPPRDCSPGAIARIRRTPAEVEHHGRGDRCDPWQYANSPRRGQTVYAGDGPRRLPAA